MVDFTGLNSVRDRTIFTNKGPISKKPLPIITGNNLRIISETDVEILTGTFSPTESNFLLQITGSFNNRNDGTFSIEKVLSPTLLRLKASSFNVVDIVATTADLVELANNIKLSYNFHLSQIIQNGSNLVGVHGTNDSVNIVSVANATNLITAIALLNDLRIKFEAHRINQSGTPDVHPNADTDNIINSLTATDLNSAIILANELKRDYENHRQEKFYHVTPDTVNQTIVNFVRPIRGTFPGPLTGPFNWTLLDPQYGRASNDPYDVAVRVNGSPVVVEAVIGQIGAIVLENKPSPGDDVKVDYCAIKSPPQKFLRLNSPEFNLNQVGSNAVSGWPGHLYSSSSYLIDPESPSPDFMSPHSPKRIGWKYKAIERAYSALLNDPTTLLLNVPTNKVSFSVLEDPQSELTIFYDPFTMPQDATDPWVAHGQGEFFLDAPEKFLSIADNHTETGQVIDPPFFSKALPIDSPSFVNSAFRMRVTEDALTYDGVFSGVAFCISDGLHLIQVGFIQSDVFNISSAIFLANALRVAFNSHVTADNVHDPDDGDVFIDLAPSNDLTSLINLTNVLKSRYNSHLAHGPLFVHQSIDSLNVVTLPDSDSLVTAMAVLNDLRPRFNAHRIQPLIHFLNDVNNEVRLVKQVGILTKNGPEEFAENWETFAIDWTQFTSYRIFRDPDGNCSIFLSGDIEPVVEVDANSLPNLADRDIDSDGLQQVFFGSISREATSISHWQFVRLTRSPVESVFIEKNKSVEYDAVTIPQLDTTNPWIDIGTSGFEKIIPGNLLLLDSTGGASIEEVASLGLSTGAFRGYLRLEPIQTPETTTSFEFRFSADFYTHSIDNDALGVVLDDGAFTIQFAFLQFTPSAAETTGTIPEPYSMVTGDTLVMRIGSAQPRTVTFASTDTSTAAVASKINAIFGFTLASNSLGRLRLTSADLGSGASFEIIGGAGLFKIGLSPGVYRGVDSNPEPKVSWFGDDFPNLKNPPWIVGGDQKSELLGNILRITDSSTTDFLTYSQENPIVTNQAIAVDRDWKMNFCFNMLSFVAGDQLPAPLPFMSLDFAGLLVNIDEGPSGKNLEVHLSVDGPDTYINLVTYNAVTGNLDIVAQYAFDWNDGQDHVISVFTNKNVNQILILGDGDLLSPIVGPTPSYSLLKSGIVGPAITFGSGSVGASNVDLSSSNSVCDWKSINIIRDSKINDPSAATRRFVGMYLGGPTNASSSYLLHQIDWALPHTYRIIRDPVTAVSLYIDGNNVPVITTSYDALTLPPILTSYLSPATAGRSIVAFGAFDSTEISRSRWDFVKYSIGKLTQTELIVPPHNLLNQHNMITSAEHLRTNLKHTHHGFTVYSGGTPQDDFLADERLIATTQLNEGTPPVPMTQDLESRGGLIKTATLVGSVPTPSFVDFPGDISNFSNDEFNIIGDYTVADLANELKQRFNNHILDTTFHDNADTINIVTTADAVSISTTITLLNDIKSFYNAHRTAVGVHYSNDVSNVVTAPNATDLTSSITLANDIRTKFSAHIISTVFHETFDVINTVAMAAIVSALDSAILAANDIRFKYLAHLSQINVHLENDVNNVDLSAEAVDLNTAILLANSEKREFNLHRVAVIRESQKVHIVDDGVNVISLSDATDIDTLTELLMNIRVKYEAHRIQPNVHAATVFISISAPSRVLYDNIKFWKTEEGESVDLTPFCDSVIFTPDSPILLADFPALDYSGSDLPELFILEQTIRLANDLKAVFNTHLVQVGVHVTNDVINTVLAANASNLATLIVLLNELKTRFNSHLIQPGVHTSNNPFNTINSVNAANLGTAQALANDIRTRYEIHRRDAVLHLIADNVNAVTVLQTPSPTNPGWQLFVDGGTPSVVDAGSSFIYSTPTLTETMYRYDNVMPRSPDVNFEFAVRMRINSFAAPTSDNYDTRIYAGFTSDMAPGVAAGIGFELIGGRPAVKIQDVNSDTPLARIIDDWRIAGFRTYRIIRDATTDEFRLTIDP